MSRTSPLQDELVIRATRVWLERAVIGLNLCPFAKSVHVSGRIRYVVSNAETCETLRIDLARELSTLAAANVRQLETTLLIHPGVLKEFHDYNQFLEVADRTLEELGLVGELQVASLHPGYCFAETEANDIENFTNRSPYPILHLLREASVARAVEAFPDASRIYEKNIATLRALGHAGWKRLMSSE